MGVWCRKSRRGAHSLGKLESNLSFPSRDGGRNPAPKARDIPGMQHSKPGWAEQGRSSEGAKGRQEYICGCGEGPPSPALEIPNST